MSSLYRFRRNRARRVQIQRGRTARSRWSMLLGLIFLFAFSGVIAAAVVGFLVYQSYASDLKSPQELISEASIRTSLVYDRNGEFLFEFIDPVGELRDPVPIADISPYLIAATVATEDASFYENPGLNVNGLLRAFRTNLPESLGGEGFGEGSGGSSITQQLVKNVYFTPEERFDQDINRKIERKIKEAVVALELKRAYDNDQILEWYLNQIPYGNFAIGAEAAAQRYFGKNVANLTLAEAAMLAGIPQAPGLFTPALPENLERAKARQSDVLDLMLKHLDTINRISWVVDMGQPITVAEIEAARREELEFVDPNLTIRAPHFVLYVEEQVTTMCEQRIFEPSDGITCDNVVIRGGLRIVTSLDLELQGIGERIVEDVISANEEATGGHNGALVAIRPETGEILTYVGSRDFFREDIDGQVDIITSLQSQGSTMKVFTYLAAFKQGWLPSTIVLDEPLELDDDLGRAHEVENWNLSHHDPPEITVRTALSQSINVSAVTTVVEVGVDEARKTAYSMGITDRRLDDCSWSITLGSCEVKLLDMAYAYSVFANTGVMKGQPTLLDLPDGLRDLDPVAVLRIEDANGSLIYEYTTPEERQVVEPAYAYLITDILSKDAIRWSRLTIDRPAATKTGTSQEFRDSLLLGYTRDLAVGVWMGNADDVAMAEKTFSGDGAGPMWNSFMLEAHAYLELPPRSFVVPASVVTSTCSASDGSTEFFVLNVGPTKPGACRSPYEGSVPVFPPRATPTPTPDPTATPPAQAIYVFKDGDTLASIAAQFGVGLAELLLANGLTEDSEVGAGDILFIPVGGQEQPGEEPARALYVVKDGDTLVSIAEQFGVDLTALLLANGLTEDSEVGAGDILFIPVGGQEQPGEESAEQGAGEAGDREAEQGVSRGSGRGLAE